MKKRIITYFLILVMLFLCLPVSAIAADDMNDDELVEMFTSKLSWEGRIEGEISVFFKAEVSNNEMYEILFDACASAYGTTDESVISPCIHFISGIQSQLITVPDEKIVDTMVMLWKSDKFLVVEPNVSVELRPLGDVTGDYDVDKIDYILLKRHCLGTYTIK